MDDFERAVLLCLDPTAAPALQAQALEYCRHIRESNDALPFALARLTSSARPEVAFWCLQVVHSVLISQINTEAQVALETPLTPSSSVVQDAASTHRQAVLDYALAITKSEAAQAQPQPVYVRNKLAQVIATQIAKDYPQKWPQAMQEFVLPLASDAVTRTPQSVEFFFRVMRALDEDVTSVRAAQSSNLARTISVRVKDGIRLDCTTEFVALVATLVSAPAYVNHAYDLIARNVEWMDIGLFTNDTFLPAMYASITSSSPTASRASSAYALKAIMLKRMPYLSKMALLKHLQILKLLTALPLSIPDAEDDPVVESGKLSGAELSIQSSRKEVASLVNCSANIAFDVLKQMGSPRKTASEEFQSPDEQQVVQFAVNIAEAAVPLALRFVSGDVEDCGSQEVLECVTAYINTFSRLNSVENGKNGVGKDGAWTWGQEGILATLKTIEEKARFPDDVDPFDTDHPFMVIRHALLMSVLRGIIRALPSTVLLFVRQAASQAAAKSSVASTELVLSMLQVLSETAPDVPGLQETLASALSNPPHFPPPVDLSSPGARQQEAVAITHFDLSARSYRFLLTSQDRNLLVAVLAPFFDSRGLLHPYSQVVRSKAAHLLLKLVRPLRSPIASSHQLSVMRAIEPLMFPVRAASSGQLFVDQMTLFETAGCLVGTDPNHAESSEYLSKLLTKVMTELSAAESADQKVGLVTAAGQLSKGFGGDSKPLLFAGSANAASNRNMPQSTLQSLNPNQSNGASTLQISPSGPDFRLEDSKDVRVERPKALSQVALATWARCLEGVLMSAGLVGPNISHITAHPKGFESPLREKVMFFFHRMVDTMGPAVVPYLRVVMKPLLELATSASEVREVIVLASQAVGKFGKEFADVLVDILCPLVTCTFQFPLEIDASTMLAVSEEGREAVELRKAYCYLLHAIMSNEIGHVFFTPVNAPLLGGILTSLVETIVGDRLDLRGAGNTMKMCMSTMTRMIMAWIPSSGGNGPTIVSTSTGAQVSFRDMLLADLPSACVRCGTHSNLLRSGDFETSAGLMVLTENVTLQRACAERLGPAFADAMRKQGMQGVQSEELNVYLSSLYQPEVQVQLLAKLFLGILRRLKGGA